MNKGRKFLRVYHKSLPLYPIKRLAPCISITTWRYSHLDRKENSHRKEEGHHGQDMAERAPSTAEEFQRVAVEKTRQGFASQTVDKAGDGSQGATMLDSDSGSVEDSFKEPPRVGKLPQDRR